MTEMDSIPSTTANIPIPSSKSFFSVRPPEDQLMNGLEKKDLLEGIGILAIVSSLVFVAMELRQANSIGHLEAMNSMAESWNTFGVELV